MPSRSKKQRANIVVRPIEQGTKQASKCVLETLGELNRHRPVLSPLSTFNLWSVSGSELMTLPGDPQEELHPQQLPGYDDPPWKQHSRSWNRRRWEKLRRNPGIGKEEEPTWLCKFYLCGGELGWSGDDKYVNKMPEFEEGSSTEDLDQEVYEYSRDDRTPSRREVAIMDIARTMKPKGTAKEYEVLDAVRQVIALEEDQMTEWMDDLGGDAPMQEWERLDWDDIRREERASYATVLRQAPG